MARLRTPSSMVHFSPEYRAALDVCRQSVLEQTIVEIPPLSSRVIRLRTYRNQCEARQQPVRSQHPLQVSTAGGATGTQLGSRAVSLASYLNKHLELPVRQTCDVLHQTVGLTVSPGGIYQEIARAALLFSLDSRKPFLATGALCYFQNILSGTGASLRLPQRYDWLKKMTCSHIIFLIVVIHLRWMKWCRSQVQIGTHECL
ncbi:hypothetical protein XM38_041400 [Halomicronema hongdechloris C2206]|uniref:Uncharacterized protein n=1 Tax=Halomicronema hongdechloris C2206 TaxID=1641165 RepID=A0A1Z3HSA7_9CYAN|nr:hypothetical protein XM38_041400 [Halomicronema hongdechloris C2206]